MPQDTRSFGLGKFATYPINSRRLPPPPIYSWFESISIHQSDLRSRFEDFFKILLYKIFDLRFGLTAMILVYLEVFIMVLLTILIYKGFDRDWRLGGGGIGVKFPLERFLRSNPLQVFKLHFSVKCKIQAQTI